MSIWSNETHVSVMHSLKCIHLGVWKENHSPKVFFSIGFPNYSLPHNKNGVDFYDRIYQLFLMGTQYQRPLLTSPNVAMQFWVVTTVSNDTCEMGWGNQTVLVCSTFCDTLRKLDILRYIFLQISCILGLGYSVECNVRFLVYYFTISFSDLCLMEV